MILFIPYWMDGRLVMIMTVSSKWYKSLQFPPKIIYTSGLSIALYVIGLVMLLTVAMGIFISLVGMFLCMAPVFLHVIIPFTICHARWARIL